MNNWTTAGQFNRRIELQKPLASRGATGGEEVAWATYATVAAAFRTLSGGERTASEQVGATLSHEITIRYRSDVLPTHRIKYGERLFDIKDVRDVDEAHVEIRMRCTEAL